MAPMTAAFTADIDHFIAARGLDLVRFAKGRRKDDVTREYLRRAGLDDRGLVPAQVLYVGVAQEKQRVFRTSKRRNPVTGATYPWLVPGSGVVNQYYFYCVDEEFGPVCVKFSSYFPYTGRLILNGNEYAKRQAAKAGIGFVPLDNAFAAVDDVAAVQAICDGLDEGAVVLQKKTPISGTDTLGTVYFDSSRAGKDVGTVTPDVAGAATAEGAIAPSMATWALDAAMSCRQATSASS